MKRPFSNRGFALPIVLCALGILAAVLVTASVFIDASLENEAITSQGFTARQLALSGVTFASVVKTKKTNFQLSRKIEGEGVFTVIRRADSGLVNLNALLQKQDVGAIARLLYFWGEDAILANRATDALMRRTWLQTGKGLTDPANFIPLESFAQLQGVTEFAEVVKNKPDWRNRLTLWGSGKANLNHATEDTLVALAGFSEGQAAAFIKARSGPDGIPETEDDAKLDSAEKAGTLMGMDETGVAHLQNYFGGDSQTIRIESSAKAGRVKRQIMVILAQSGESGWNPIMWNED